MAYVWSLPWGRLSRPLLSHGSAAVLPVSLLLLVPMPLWQMPRLVVQGRQRVRPQAMLFPLQLRHRCRPSRERSIPWERQAPTQELPPALVPVWLLEWAPVSAPQSALQSARQLALLLESAQELASTVLVPVPAMEMVMPKLVRA